MPKSKRNKIVALTKTKKANFHDKKSKLIEKVHEYIEKYEYTYSFTFKNMTNSAFQALRDYWKDDDNSVFLFGKTTTLHVALGKGDEDAHKPKMDLLGKNLRGNSGLFFSDKEPTSVIKYFDEYSCPYFPTPGFIAKESVVLKRGLPKELKGIPSSMEEQFRQIGLKLKLDATNWYLLEDFDVCVEGKEITPNQTKLMRILGLRIDEFKIKIGSYNTKTGDYKLVDAVGYNNVIFKNKNNVVDDDEGMSDIDI